MGIGHLDDMTMPRVPDQAQEDSSDGPPGCSVFDMWPHEFTQLIDYVIGKKHRGSSTLKRYKGSLVML